MFAEGSDLLHHRLRRDGLRGAARRETLAARGIAARVVDLHTPEAARPRAHRALRARDRGDRHRRGAPGERRAGRARSAEVVVQTCPVPMELVAVHDRFGQSGKPAELMDAFGLRAKDIVAAADRVLQRKRSRG